MEQAKRLTFSKLVLFAFILGASFIMPAWAEQSLQGGNDESSAVALSDSSVTTLTGGWYAVNGDITFTSDTDRTIWLSGDVTLNLAQGKTMTVTNDNGWGIFGQDTSVNQHSLTVLGGGTLDVTSTGTAIIRVSKYTQTGGTVKLTCSSSGHGLAADTGPVSISGGSLEATGGNGGTGICANSITVSGGRVTAKGEVNGIDATTVEITSGDVTAAAENSSAPGYDIFGHGGVTITGGKVTANKKGIGVDSGGTITLGYKNADDSITLNVASFNGTVKIADGKSMTDGRDIYTGTLTDAQKTALRHTTLTRVIPATNGIYSVAKEGTAKSGIPDKA